MRIFFFILIFIPLLTTAQQNDTQLAYTYYNDKEYEKAAELFLKLYERTHSSEFLDYHIICLINGKQYEKAVDILERLVKTDGSNKELLVNLGYVYGQQGKTGKAGEQYRKAIGKLIPYQSDITSLAGKFSSLREYEWAIKTYQKGSELLKKPDAFLYELGESYMMDRNYEKMFFSFIRALETNPLRVDNIISNLNYARSTESAGSIDSGIEKNLNEIFSRKEYNPVFDELASWYMAQKENYGQALSHAVRLDNLSENKTRVLADIGIQAKNTGNYTVARQAFSKVLEKGKENNPFYPVAQKEILYCKYAESGQKKTDAPAYKAIAGECRNYLLSSGYTNDNADIIMLLADIYAYKINLPDSAVILLQKAEGSRQLNINILSRLKFKRAELLTFTDSPWEALILYTQIEKSNPNNDTGYEAKLKKAQLAYYTGDLVWAKAQFDILKGATSKLTANDAIKTAWFLQSNYDEKGENSLLEKLAKTEYLIYKKDYRTAIPALDSIIAKGGQGLAVYASLLKAGVLTAHSDYTGAAGILEKLKKADEEWIRAEAIFKLAGVKVKMYDKEKAKELYKKLVSEHTGSVYSIEAARIYNELNKSKE